MEVDDVKCAKTGSAIRSGARSLILLSGLIYLLLVLALFLTIRAKNGGHFTYALDDPYIHLALAENLAHGHYGINASEFSSPSSSILWSFLLIPFAGTPFHTFVPLVWNLIFGVLSACLIGFVVTSWSRFEGQSGATVWLKQAVTAALVMLIANLASLTIIGMEHVLQVLTAICCAIGLMYALSDEAIPNYCLVAAALAPMVRYEDLSLSVAVALALVGMHERRKAVILLGVSVLPLVAFSVFLHAKGLPLLPMSVLVKGGAYGNPPLSMKVYQLLKLNLYHDLVDPENLSTIIFFLIFASVAWRSQFRIRRFVFGGATLVAALQLTIGRFGWFGRYEVYSLIFLVVLSLYLLAERPPMLFGYFAMGLLFCAATFLRTTEETVGAAQDVYRNQYQMHRFVTEYYRGDYAVNDIGLVSFQRRPGAYVLDLFGLGSLESSRQQVKTAAWMKQTVDRHKVRLAMIFPRWFEIPASWVPVGKMCQPRPPIFLPDSCVYFYSTSIDSSTAIHEDLERFATTLPEDVVFSLLPEQSADESEGK